MKATEKRELAIARKLAILFEGREWQKYPSASQQKFQSLMIGRARQLLKLADEPYSDDTWESVSKPLGPT
jgi:hypothetical protein